MLILLGSGEAEYENRIADIAEHADNLLFLCGYSATLAEPLYRSGDLFLMPSSFEPCGISQMLAMRAAQPCVVHGVGGLRDTVEDGRSGFVFTGATPQEQASNFVAAVRRIGRSVVICRVGTVATRWKEPHARPEERIQPRRGGPNEAQGKHMRVPRACVPPWGFGMNDAAAE